MFTVYNVIISAVQQGDSVIYIHIYVYVSICIYIDIDVYTQKPILFQILFPSRLSQSIWFIFK